MKRCTATAWGIAGLVFAAAPALLFAMAAFSKLGPTSATRVFAVPVVLSTIISTVVAAQLIRHRARRWGLAVAWTTVIFGVMAYAAWINLALLGTRAGDGPL